MCQGKVKYFTEKDAKVAAKYLHKKRKARFNVYSCGFCGARHIGTDRSPRQGELRSMRRGFDLQS